MAAWLRTMSLRLVMVAALAAALLAVPPVLPGAPTAPHAAAATPATLLTSVPLLLVHGWSDSCRVFNQVDTDTPDQGDGSGKTAVDYLTHHGFNRDKIYLVGYYAPGYTWNAHWTNHGNVANDYTDAVPAGGGHPNPNGPGGDCDANVQNSDPDSSCYTYRSKSDDAANYLQGVDGYTNDPILHLACMFAWYVYNTFTVHGIAVNILAHSMGGLVVRAAMDYSGGPTPKPGFPSDLLLVDRVVTVGTPHGGLDGVVAGEANTIQSGQPKPSDEIIDMTVCPNMAKSCSISFSYDLVYTFNSATMHTSAFMTDLILWGTPRGANHAVWMLMGSSLPDAMADATVTSWVNNLPSDAPDRFSDTDWVVPVQSQLDLDADFKILYGELDDRGNNNLRYTTGGVDYAHEANTCAALATGWDAFWLTFGTGISGQPCPAPPYYLNDGSSDTTYAWTCTASCHNTTNGVQDMGVQESNSPADPAHYGATSQLRSLAEITRLLLAPPVEQAGHAMHAGDDYPYAGLGMYDRHEGTDPWDQYYGQCDSFASWKVYENLGGTQTPNVATIPAAGFTPTDATLSPVVGYAGKASKTGTWGDATDWLNDADTYHVPRDTIPQPGAIAVWTQAQTGWTFGHVGYVTDVYEDGSINIESYNLRDRGLWTELHFPAHGSATDTSFNQQAATIPWPAGFVHIGDGAGAAWPQAAPTPTFHYPINTYGPNNGSYFTLAGATPTHGWTEKPGVGEIGTMDYTYTHAGATDSTATWSPPLSAYTCYEIDAFVPDNDSNDATALYKIVDNRFGTSWVPLDEENWTNQFVPLGVFQANPNGTLPVTLNDNAEPNLIAGADAMRFVQQPGCPATRTAQIIDPTTTGFTLAGSGTNHGWTALSGHGLLGNDLWTHTHAGNPDSTATYAATGLSPYTCYSVSAFVPDNDANSPSALYISGATMGAVNENSYTNQWAPIGQLQANGSGAITVMLTDNSPSGLYVSADAVAFMPGACSLGMSSPVLDPNTTGFSMTPSAWSTDAGHGLRGVMRWHTTSGSSTNTTATAVYQPVLFVGCYSVSAFVPDVDAYANPATYALLTTTGGSSAASTGTVNEAALSNVWAVVGLVNVSAGSTTTVTLTNAATSGHVGADAVMFTPVQCASPLNPYNYPWPTQDGWVGDGHGYYEGECVSFAAWALRSDGLSHTATSDFLGNADKWHGAYVDSTPHVGDIAQWDDNHNAAGPFGHVAYVAAVYTDGTIQVDEYNWGTFHRLNIRTIPATAPSRYLHF